MAAVLLALVLGLGIAIHDAMREVNADGDDSDVAEQPARVAIKNGIVTLTLNEADQQNAGIVTACLQPKQSSVSVEAFGKVLDTTSLGIIDDAYLNARTQVALAKSRLAISQATFQRARFLNTNGQTVSTAQMQGQQASFEADEATLTVARAQLSSTINNARTAWGSVLAAAIIDQAPLLKDIVARHDYLIKVTVPFAAAGKPPKAVALTLNGRSAELNYISLADSADPHLQSVSYFYAMPADRDLVPGVTLEVSAISDGGAGSFVPISAVVWLDGKSWIYLRTDATHFVRRQIASDRPADRDGYLVADLPAGAEVVVAGAAMLLSEEGRALLPEDKV